MPAPRTPAEYFAQQPKEHLPVLKKVRAAIKKAMPKAEEVISYGIVGYVVNGRRTLYLSGWKKHFSLHPVGNLARQLGDEVRPFIASKGTVKFPYDQKPPMGLITRIAKIRNKGYP